MAHSELYVEEVQNGLVVSSGSLDKELATYSAEFVNFLAAFEWGLGAYVGARAVPTRNEIAQLAYCLYEARGRKDGHAIEDWLAAERELFHHTHKREHQPTRQRNSSGLLKRKDCS